VITTDNGTQYYFGLNLLPGYPGTAPANKITDSCGRLPVAGTTDGEPCTRRRSLGSLRQQAWQWNLTTSRTRTATRCPLLHAGGQLLRRTTPDRQPTRSSTTVSDSSTRRLSGTDDRAGTDTEETSHLCAEAGPFQDHRPRLADCNPHDVSHWSDTHWGQSCTSSTSCQGIYSPTFFLTQRLNTPITNTGLGPGAAAYRFRSYT